MDEASEVQYKAGGKTPKVHSKESRKHSHSTATDGRGKFILISTRNCKYVTENCPKKL
jgi:hypothetical protein